MGGGTTKPVPSRRGRLEAVLPRSKQFQVSEDWDGVQNLGKPGVGEAGVSILPRVLVASK